MNTQRVEETAEEVKRSVCDICGEVEADHGIGWDHIFVVCEPETKPDGAEVWDKDSIPFDVALERVAKEISDAQRAILEKGHSRAHIMFSSVVYRSPYCIPARDWTIFSDVDEVTGSTLAEAVAKIPSIKTDVEKRELKASKLRAELAKLEKEGA